MAKVDGVIQGRVGNMIFYQVNGVTRVRTAPPKIRDPNTPKQQANRNRFIVALRFYQRMKDTFLPIVWQLGAKGMAMSGYNLFMRLNISVFNERTIFDPAHLVLTLGSLPRMNKLMVKERQGNCVTLEWENSLNVEGAHTNDHLQVVALFEGRMYTPVWLKEVRAHRCEQVVQVDLGKDWKRTVHLYCFFASPDGSAYSASSYICIHPNDKV